MFTDVIMYDPCMTLEDWKGLVDELILKYGKDYYMYTDSSPCNCALEVKPS